MANVNIAKSVTQFNYSVISAAVVKTGRAAAALCYTGAKLIAIALYVYYG